MEQWGIGAARQGVHPHIFEWDLQSQLLQLLSFQPCLKSPPHSSTSCAPAWEGPALGWAAKLIPSPSSTFGFVPPADFTVVKLLLADLCPSLQGQPAQEGRARKCPGEGPWSRRLQITRAKLLFPCVVFGTVLNALCLSFPA